MSTITVHSGYEFPGGVFYSTFHDNHHAYFMFNFGTIGLCDFIHGTTYFPKKSEKETTEKKD